LTQALLNLLPSNYLLRLSVLNHPKNFRSVEPQNMTSLSKYQRAFLIALALEYY
jgi:hypothetical protein